MSSSVLRADTIRARPQPRLTLGAEWPASRTASNPAPLAGSVNWSTISPRGRQMLGQIGYRLAAGLTLDEVAEQLDRERPPLVGIEWPKTVTKGWVSKELRVLKQEIRQAAS